jgi:hypothetical protein
LLQPFHEQRRQFDARNPSSRHWNLSVSKDGGAQGGLTGCSDAITRAPQPKEIVSQPGRACKVIQSEFVIFGAQRSTVTSGVWRRGIGTAFANLQIRQNLLPRIVRFR